MANYAKLTFALPEDTDSNYLQIWSAATKTGVYSQVGSDIAYSYGTTTYEFEDLVVTSWYKIRFYNLSETNYGPYSEPVYGGDWTESTKPFLAVSTTSDGANYATIQDVFDYSGLTTEDVTEDRVSQALRRSRAIIDLRTADMGIDRFQYTFKTSITRRKYNASLRVVKEAETCFALGMVYRGLADDEVIGGIRSSDLLGSVSVGSTSVTVDRSKKGIENSSYFSRLAQKYTLVGVSMLQLLSPTSITLTWQEDGSRMSRTGSGFLNPADPYR